MWRREWFEWKNVDVGRFYRELREIYLPKAISVSWRWLYDQSGAYTV